LLVLYRRPEGGAEALATLERRSRSPRHVPRPRGRPRSPLRLL